jgi:hypothetical protein
MALNYPANQDTTIESWTLTNDAEQFAYFGKIYGIGELIPVNYNEILTDLIAGNIPYAPLREYVFAEKQWTRTQIISENTNLKVKAEMFTRELDAVRVKGKNEPVKIFELDIVEETVDRIDCKELARLRR